MADLLSSQMRVLTLDTAPQTFVDTETALAHALRDMRHDTMFALDCEGVNLGRCALSHLSILIQVLDHPIILVQS